MTRWNWDGWCYLAVVVFVFLNQWLLLALIAAAGTVAALAAYSLYVEWRGGENY